MIEARHFHGHNLSGDRPGIIGIMRMHYPPLFRSQKSLSLSLSLSLSHYREQRSLDDRAEDRDPHFGEPVPTRERFRRPMHAMTWKYWKYGDVRSAPLSISMCRAFRASPLCLTHRCIISYIHSRHLQGYDTTHLPLPMHIIFVSHLLSI
ncbi:hypothetical protein KP509_34G002800 [Ceratopteris richardii]|uniref:Uncharacterized protein n=1 Tax=Ceratopteris richardii TaxID=49495 RepID=A0A8T2QIA7_CERRI|nr:hypothetical protein KP509_34G002800 [Ceratopteris richardii]